MNTKLAAYLMFGEAKVAAAPSLAQMEQAIQRIPVSRQAGLFPMFPDASGVWRRKTLSDIAASRGMADAIKTYRLALKASAREIPLTLVNRLKAFKQYKATSQVPSISGLGTVKRDSITPGRGEDLVRLTSYGPRGALERALKDPASPLEPFYVPGRTRAANEGLFFWEGDGPATFTASPRGYHTDGLDSTPAKLTLEMPRSSVYATGKHTELTPTGERVAPREDILRYARNATITPVD